ncbi:MAG: hypothetical protein GY861_22340 [bacterium]|nr:hypothetical protein [bacterium]
MNCVNKKYKIFKLNVIGSAVVLEDPARGYFYESRKKAEMDLSNDALYEDDTYVILCVYDT